MAGLPEESTAARIAFPAKAWTNAGHHLLALVRHQQASQASGISSQSSRSIAAAMANSSSPFVLLAQDGAELLKGRIILEQARNLGRIASFGRPVDGAAVPWAVGEGDRGLSLPLKRRRRGPPRQATWGPLSAISASEGRGTQKAPALPLESWGFLQTYWDQVFTPFSIFLLPSAVPLQQDQYQTSAHPQRQGAGFRDSTSPGLTGEQGRHPYQHSS